MKLILCVDDKGGLAFNHRRQSRDRVLNERILMHCGMHRLWISPYTAKLFGEDTAVRLCIAEDCLERAKEDRKSTRLNSSHKTESRMPSSA